MKILKDSLKELSSVLEPQQESTPGSPGPITNERLLSALNWTEESHPTRQQLELEASEAQLAYKAAPRKKWWNDDCPTENKRDEALAKLQIWDVAFGPKTKPIDFDDPATIAAAKERQDYLLKTIIPMPSHQEQLAALRQPPDVIKKLMEEEEKNRARDNTYAIISAEEVFNAIEENKSAMSQLNKSSTRNNLMEFNGGYIPVSYLVAHFKKENEDKAINLLSRDLQILAAHDVIVGNLSGPKVLCLSEESFALYCWPFIDCNKLAASVGKNFSTDFKYDSNELLKFVGIKSVAFEGMIGDEIT